MEQNDLIREQETWPKKEKEELKHVTLPNMSNLQGSSDAHFPQVDMIL